MKEYKMYRKLLKNKQRRFKAQRIGKMDSLHDQDPTAFWDIVHKLKDSANIKRDAGISADVWHQHFKSLMTDPQTTETEFDKFVENFIKHDEHTTQSFSELDFKVTVAEVLKVVGRLKNGKAQGLDSIPNEMLKSGKKY